MSATGGNAEAILHTDSVEYIDAGARLARIEQKLDFMLDLLVRYQPLLDQAEKRLKPKFGGGRARG